jgi:hypothetical protein
VGGGHDGAAAAEGAALAAGVGRLGPGRAAAGPVRQISFRTPSLALGAAQGPLGRRLPGLISEPAADLEEVPDAADGGSAQDDLEEDARTTDDQREAHDGEVLQQDT